MWDSVKSIVGAVAPALGTALGGPLGGLAAGQLTQWLGLSPKATPKEIAERLQGLPPEQLVELTRIEKQFEAEKDRLALEALRLDQADRVSARDRQIKMSSYGSTFGFMEIFAILIIIIFAAMIVLIAIGPIKPDAKTMLDVLATFFGGLTLQVGNFFFGSSVGSRYKDVKIDAFTNEKILPPPFK
jgi:hypothetical protein